MAAKTIAQTLQGIQLTQSGAEWKFANEGELELLIWACLPHLLDCQPLQRQFRVSNQCCDILAVSQQRLTVVELKVAEDRYLIPQLTRYFDALQREQPFADQVDYQRSIRLLAIAPSYHADNFTDIRYSQLSFELYQYQIRKHRQKHYLTLLNLETQEQRHQEIPVLQLPSHSEDLPEPPRLMQNWIKRCTPEQSAGLLKLRAKILKFDPRIQETAQDRGIYYGKGKKYLAELRIDPAGEFCIFLWLSDRRYFSGQVRRIRYWTNWITAGYWGPCSSGFKLSVNWGMGSYRFAKAPGLQENLSDLTDKALKHWLERIN
ncbi:hypothetical protein [Synechococcus elongatus]|uniref:DUF91 domain-containing protein n=2 Tax=Synechococcus elongatus TaxID=32046 RepID=Q31MB2_SYNE7|nr:hypothetical protein [Synechococcus elongatus]ABB57807.1 conserved hypothetical protein [Synechococcus elongatus PCC 7942 = FACHB-805]AJD57708.1 hypothetical protein M744_07595 [Synechococcus elongatus UTEX 2973]MBD2586523.1 hypothetical protein [Synechococcus elongatus FACHB-242]MBD2687597.1 hypothetical protein [Synechococcus elongatus FACHB-1061]MBD2706694.1 hypothetical protein [Synechococcus elongatus PCC 7942 = FACHB-805]